MSSPTPRLGLVLVEDDDTIGGTDSFKSKVNDALSKVDFTAGEVLCTSITRPITNLFPGLKIRETDTGRSYYNPSGTVGDWRLTQEDTVGSVGNGSIRPVRPVRPYGGDSAYAATASVTVRPDGVCLMVWRQGSNSGGTLDGGIYRATSSDQGRTWSASTLIASIATVDLRYPCVSMSRSGTTVYLSYHKAVSGNAGGGVFFRASTDGGTTWSAEVRVEAQSFAASTGPVVELDNGTLVIPWYGRGGADTFHSVWTSKSTDSGVTWVETKILNGQSISTDIQDPWITMRGQSGVMAYRYGGSQIGISTTSDNTANWSGVAPKFASSTLARPTIWWANDTTVACMYRRSSLGDGVLRLSRDGGASWMPERLLEKAWTTAGGFRSGGVAKLGPSTTICVFGMESSSATARVFTTQIAEGGAMTALGVVPAQDQAIVTGFDTTVFATQFDQADGALPYPWIALVGGVTVTAGEAASTAADNSPDHIMVNTSARDYTIDADIYTENGGGAGVIFRASDDSNFLHFEVSSDRTRARLYKRVSGTFTALVEVRGFTLEDFAYHRYRVVVRRGKIACYIDGIQIISNTLSSSDYSAFSARYGVGLRLNSNGTNINKCNRFVVTTA